MRHPSSMGSSENHGLFGQNGNGLGIDISNPLAGAADTSDASGNENGNGDAGKGLATQQVRDPTRGGGHAAGAGRVKRLRPQARADDPHTLVGPQRRRQRTAKELSGRAGNATKARGAAKDPRTGGPTVCGDMLTLRINRLLRTLEPFGWDPRRTMYPANLARLGVMRDYQRAAGRRTTQDVAGQAGNAAAAEVHETAVGMGTNADLQQEPLDTVAASPGSAEQSPAVGVGGAAPRGGGASSGGGAPGGGVPGLQDAGWEPRLDERMYTQAGLEAAAARIALIDPVVRLGEAERLIGVEEATDALAQAASLYDKEQAVADQAWIDAAVACVALDEALEQRKADLSEEKAGWLAAARAARTHEGVQQTCKASILKLDNAIAAVQECREQLASGAVTFTLEDVQQIHPTLGEPAKTFLDRRAAALKAEAEARDAAELVEAMLEIAEARAARFSRIVRAGEAQVAALRAKSIDDPLQQLRTLLAWSRSYLRRLPEEQRLAAVEEAAVAVEPSLMDNLKSHYLSVCTGQQQRGSGNEDACAFMMELGGYLLS